MSTKAINFVSVRRKALTKTQQHDKEMLRYAVFGFGGVVIVLVVVLVVRLFYSIQVRNIKKEEDKLRGLITQQGSVEQDYTLFAHKLKELVVLFDKRRDKQEALAYFRDAFGPQVVVRQLQYSATTQLLTFVLQSESIFVLETVFTKLEEAVVSSQYESISKSGLRRSDDGSYTMQLSVLLGDGEVVATPKPATSTSTTNEN